MRCIKLLITKEIFDVDSIIGYFKDKFEILERAIRTDQMNHGIDGCAGKFKDKNVCDQRTTSALIIVGIFSKHVDPSQLQVAKNQLFECYVHYIQSTDDDVRSKALCGIGYFLQRCPELLTDERIIQTLMCTMKSSTFSPITVTCALNILHCFFRDDSVTSLPEIYNSETSSSLKLQEDTSSLSQMAQTFLKPLLVNFLNKDVTIRESSLNVVASILYQGFAHPAMCLPYLMCASSIPPHRISSRAEILMREVHTKYPSFLISSILFGMRLSYKLHAAVNSCGGHVTRGYTRVNGKSFACMDALFSMLQNKTQFHSFVLSLLKCFSESSPMNSQTCGIEELLYLTDNLSCFPYTSLEEVSFLFNHIDLILSACGSNVLQDFKMIFDCNPESKKKVTKKKKNKQKSDTGMKNSKLVGCKKSNKDAIDNSDAENHSSKETILGIVRNLSEEGIRKMVDACSSAHRYLLLIYLKCHLLSMFNITERNIREYPSIDCKSMVKSLQRKEDLLFQPKLTVMFISSNDNLDEMVDCYLQLKNHFDSNDTM